MKKNLLFFLLFSVSAFSQGKPIKDKDFLEEMNKIAKDRGLPHD